MPTENLRDTGLVKLSLVRPVTIMMVLLSFIVIGVVALVNIPIELIPAGFSPPFMQVEVPYANATAQDIEDRITRPLEQALSTTPKLDELSATSRSDRASLSLVFESDTDMNVAYREVRDRVARARADLPSDVERVRINKQSGASMPVAFYGISWDETRRPAARQACRSTWSAPSSASTASAWSTCGARRTARSASSSTARWPRPRASTSSSSRRR
jgi:HAE1 family hydrophobic/amphiphilic exporter-1